MVGIDQLAYTAHYAALVLVMFFYDFETKLVPQPALMCHMFADLLRHLTLRFRQASQLDSFLLGIIALGSIET
jgi:hypothetical protein